MSNFNNSFWTLKMRDTYYCFFAIITIMARCSNWVNAENAAGHGGLLPHGCLYGRDQGSVLCKGDFQRFPESIPSNSTENLNLRATGLLYLYPDDLKDFNSLKILDLSHNALSHIESNIFSSQKELESLYLEHNEISVIENGAFQGLSNLRHLYLNHNRIRFLPRDTFSQLSRLNDLRLDDNEVKTLYNYLLDEFAQTKMKLLSLDRNPIQCTCDLLHLENWLRTHRVTLLRSKNVRCITNGGESKTIMGICTRDVTCVPYKAPRNLRVEELSCTSIQLHWSYTPLRPGLEDRPTVSFNAWIKIHDTRPTLVSALPHIHILQNNTAMIEGLKPGLEYQFRVQPVNTVGQGPVSQPIVHTIDTYIAENGERKPCSDHSLESQDLFKHLDGAILPEFSTTDVPSQKSDYTVLIAVSAACISAIIVLGIFLLARNKRKFGSRFSFPKVSFQKCPEKLPHECRLESIKHKVEAYFPRLKRALPKIHELTEIPGETVRFVEDICSGEFGRLYKAQVYDLKLGESSTTVVIHEINMEASTAVKQEFDSRVSWMCIADHPNVLRVLGLITASEPVSVLYEHMECGDLKRFLQVFAAENAACVNGEASEHSAVHAKLVSMVAQVAYAMSYLSALNFTHGDLAARNCMVTADLTVKVANLGTGPNLYPNDYVSMGNKLQPLRWMAPETIQRGIKNRFTDVWSFGVLLWEVFALGHQPYCGVEDIIVVNSIIKGLLLMSPDLCPTEVYCLMLMCWKKEETERLSFAQLHQNLSSLQLK